MAGANCGEVAAVSGNDGVAVQAFSKGDNGSIDPAKGEVLVLGDKL